MLEMHETFETKNIKRFKRFKHQALKPILTFVRACPEFNSGMTATGMILSAKTD